MLICIRFSGRHPDACYCDPGYTDLAVFLELQSQQGTWLGAKWRLRGPAIDRDILAYREPANLNSNIVNG